MRRREASVNDVPIRETERRLRWSQGPRPPITQDRANAASRQRLADSESREPFCLCLGPICTERSVTEGSMPDGGAAVHPDDVMLLAALRRGNGDAAAAVMQRHNRALWRIARGILGDDGEAEEAVQDTWLRAFTTSHAYRGEASLGTWLARIAINEAIRRADRRRPTVELDPIADLLPVDHPGSATMAPVGPEQAAARAEIRRVVGKRSIRYRRRSALCS